MCVESDESKAISSTNSEVQLRSLESCIIFVLLSKFDNHQSDMMHRVKQQLNTLFKNVAMDSSFGAVLNLFTTDEIIVRPFHGQDIIEAHPCLGKISNLQPDIVSHFVKQLGDRVVQHNLRVVSKYYKRIRIERLCVLLSLDAETLEAYLSDMSSAGDMYLKIDRPAGTVSFQKHVEPDEMLSDWSSDIGKMLQLMEATCHLINRENMVYKV